jgi:hypothetical protein
MPIKKINNYQHTGLTVISNTDEYIQDKNFFFLQQNKLGM